MAADHRIFLFRHGETEWNLSGRAQGWSDSPLTDRGRAQAWRMGEGLRAALRPQEQVRLHVSPSGRCRRTAELLVQAAGLHHAAAEVEDDLREVGFGLWEGLTWAELEQRHPEQLVARDRDLWSFAPPEGESFAAALARARRWLAAALSFEETLVVVSHGALGRFLRGSYRGLEPEEMLAQDSPQDAFYLLSGGRLQRIELGG